MGAYRNIRPILGACQDVIGYQFSNPKLLERALRHASSKTESEPSNERLEFLGDAILGFVICEYLFKKFPGITEGELTEIKSIVVSSEPLSEESRELGLDRFLVVGKGLKPHSRRHRLPTSVCADTFEAVIAAIYLDGGIRKARKFILSRLKRHIATVREDKHKKNYKSELQQYVQQHFNVTPRYRLLRESGPAHLKRFELVALIGGKEHGRGYGTTKKEAEQEAAKTTLQILTRTGDCKK